jgi:WD40 repeat protein/serine/threonine protein kinase
MNDPESREETLLKAIRRLHGLERAAILNELSAAEGRLRRRIEARLAAEEAAAISGESASEPQAGAAQDATLQSVAERSEGPGSIVGRYKLLQQIGEGGMGVVYMAEQQEPVIRRVALKIIKLGMDTRQVVARFEAERQALALMDHPNIAQVFDGGATENGRPYFVMELVRGPPITKYCDEQRLTTRERIELFIQVCKAVQHAHQKGVIHRDLKPSNILVMESDGGAVPKVIDFGVARATAQRLTEKTLFTGFGQMVGTPAYMSPEQAGLGGLDIDTRSDIYSLGIVFYELLTGRTPLLREEVLAAGYEEVRRIIREKDPPRPSTRLSTLPPAERSTIAAQRKIPPEKLVRLVRGELDWVVMRALEKDRKRRYETANALARDLERYLNQEPVSAAAPNLSYQLIKSVKRHRVLLGAIGLVVSLLLVGLVSTLIQMLRANRYAAETRKTAMELAENLYVAEMYLAQHAVLEGNYGLARRRLESLRPVSGGKDFRGFEWSYLWRICKGDLLSSWHAHSNAVRSLAVSPDGRLVASASYDDHEGKIWDSTTHTCVRTFADTDTFQFSPEGDLIFAAGEREQVDVWNARSMEREFSLKTGAPLASDRPTVRIAVSPASSNPLLAVCPDGSFFGGAGSIRLYDYRQRRELLKLLDSGDRAVFSRDGSTLVTGSAAGKIYVWDVASGKFWKVISGKKILALGSVGGISSMALSPDGKLLATTEFWGNFIRLWDLDEGKELPPLPGYPPGHQTMVWQVAFSPDGQLLASVSSDQTVRLWQVETRRLLKRLNGHTSEIWSVVFAPDGQKFYTGSKDESIAVWSSAVNLPNNSFSVGDTSMAPPLFSSDSRLIAARGEDSATNTEVTVRDVSTSEVRTHLIGEFAPLWFSPSNLELLTLNTNSELHFCNVSNAAVRQSVSLTRGVGRVSRAVASQDGQWVAALSQDRPGIWLVAANSGRIETELDSNFSTDAWMTFSGDTQFLAAAGGRSLEVWDLRTRKLATRQKPHKDGITSVAFSPDGRLMTSTSIDDTVKVWSVAGWRELATLTGHREGVMRSAFSPDGHTLVSGCADGTVKLWHTPTFREIAHYEVVRPTYHVGFSPDGRTLAIAPGSGTLYLLRGPSVAEIDAEHP